MTTATWRIFARLNITLYPKFGEKQTNEDGQELLIQWRIQGEGPEGPDPIPIRLEEILTSTCTGS